MAFSSNFKPAVSAKPKDVSAATPIPVKSRGGLSVAVEASRNAREIARVETSPHSHQNMMSQSCPVPSSFQKDLPPLRPAIKPIQSGKLPVFVFYSLIFMVVFYSINLLVN